MRLLLDENYPLDATASLTATGHDVDAFGNAVVEKPRPQIGDAIAFGQQRALGVEAGRRVEQAGVDIGDTGAGHGVSGPRAFRGARSPAAG